MAEPEASTSNLSTKALVASKSATGVRQMFHDIAPHYDRLNRLLSLRTDCRWRKLVAKRVLRDTDKAVLDLCSGTGDLALAFAAQARRLGASPLIVSADFTAAMTRLALLKFKRSPEFSKRPPLPLVADTLCVPFSDASFDVVSVAFGIRNVENLHQGLGEMFRVCRPGGRVAILEFSHPCQPILRRAYDWYFFRVLPKIGSLISGTTAYSYLPASVAKFPDTKEFAAILEGYGVKVTTVRLSFGIATMYVAEKGPTRAHL